MMQKNGSSVLILGTMLLVLVNASPSRALTVGFVPVSQEVAVGTPADVAIVISGLGDSAPDSLSVFDLDVLFDPTILAFDSAAFGDPVLGDQLDLFGFGSIADVILGAGTVNLFELSLDLASDLDTLQAGSFTLATLTFDTLAVGASPLDLSINALGDAFGDPLAAEVSAGSVSAIPEPTAFLAFIVGSVVVGYGIRRSPTDTPVP